MSFEPSPAMLDKLLLDSSWLERFDVETVLEDAVKYLADPANAVDAKNWAKATMDVDPRSYFDTNDFVYRVRETP